MNNNNRKHKKVLDTQVMRKIEELEENILSWVDKVSPAKFKSSLNLQMIHALYEAKSFMIDGLGLWNKIFTKQKYWYINKAQNKLTLVQTILNRWNDHDGSMSDSTKAWFDMKLDSIQEDIVRLLSSLSNNIDIAGQIDDTTVDSQTYDLEGHLTEEE